MKTQVPDHDHLAQWFLRESKKQNRRAAAFIRRKEKNIRRPRLGKATKFETELAFGRRGKIRRKTVVLYTKSSRNLLKESAPHMVNQGALKQTVRVHPYGEGDFFTVGHRVNVFHNGSGGQNIYDVIDANCNLVLRAGIRKSQLRQIVAW